MLPSPLQRSARQKSRADGTRCLPTRAAVILDCAGTGCPIASLPAPVLELPTNRRLTLAALDRVEEGRPVASLPTPA